MYWMFFRLFIKLTKGDPAMISHFLVNFCGLFVDSPMRVFAHGHTLSFSYVDLDTLPTPSQASSLQLGFIKSLVKGVTELFQYSFLIVVTLLVLITPIVRESQFFGALKIGSRLCVSIVFLISFFFVFLILSFY